MTTIQQPPPPTTDPERARYEKMKARWAMRSLWVALFPLIIAGNLGNSGDSSDKIVAWLFLVPVIVIIRNKWVYAGLRRKFEAKA